MKLPLDMVGKCCNAGIKLLALPRPHFLICRHSLAWSSSLSTASDVTILMYSLFIANITGTSYSPFQHCCLGPSKVFYNKKAMFRVITIKIDVESH